MVFSTVVVGGGVFQIDPLAIGMKVSLGTTASCFGRSWICCELDR